MNTLENLKSGIDQAWQTLAEGWQQFRSKAVHALTRFNPVRSKPTGKAIDVELEKNAMRWGVLAAELSEDDNNITIKLEAPGMDPEDFDITIIGSDLLIRGEKRAQSETTQGHYHIMECAYGSFERIIPLNCLIDEAHTKARYKKGVLNLSLRKKNKPHSNRIPIQ